MENNYNISTEYYYDTSVKKYKLRMDFINQLKEACNNKIVPGYLMTIDSFALLVKDQKMYRSIAEKLWDIEDNGHSVAAATLFYQIMKLLSYGIVNAKDHKEYEYYGNRVNVIIHKINEDNNKLKYKVNITFTNEEEDKDQGSSPSDSWTKHDICKDIINCTN